MINKLKCIDCGSKIYFAQVLDDKILIRCNKCKKINLEVDIGGKHE